MLSILIVDDSDDKVRVVKEYLRSFPSIRADRVDIADSVVTAIDKIQGKRYDLVIIDLYLPYEKGDNPTPENGLLLIELIRKDEEMLKPLHVVGLTRETITAEHNLVFQQTLWFLLQYEENSVIWKEQLQNLIEYMINSKKMLQEKKDFDFDVAIITALQKPEHYWLQKVLSDDWDPYEVPGDDCTTYFTTKMVTKGHKEIRVITCFANQMGSTASSMLTTKIIYNFRPRYLFMTGIAAGVKKDGEVSLGDVLVASEVWDGACGKIKDGLDQKPVFAPDVRQKSLDNRFQTFITKLSSNELDLSKINSGFPGIFNKPNTVLKVHLGPMASVPAVISSDKIISQLELPVRKIIGIEMESYGMFYAAENSIGPRPEIVASLKSVSDFANSDKNDNFQDYASYTSAAVLKYIMLNDLKF